MPDPSLSPTREKLAEAMRDWLHETPMSRCNMGSDTCATWPLAYEAADFVLACLVPSDS